MLALIPLSLVLREVKAGYQLGHILGKVNHHLFMDDLELYDQNKKQIDKIVSTVQIFSKDIGMKFGISTCATLIMKRGIIFSKEGIQLPNDEVIRNTEDGELYKYFGIMEADRFKNLEMKKKVGKDYFCKIKKILKSKLNSGNIMNVINLRAVALIGYGTRLIKWRKIN